MTPWQHAVARQRAAEAHGHSFATMGLGRVAFGRTVAESERKHERLNRGAL